MCYLSNRFAYVAMCICILAATGCANRNIQVIGKVSFEQYLENVSKFEDFALKVNNADVEYDSSWWILHYAKYHEHFARYISELPDSISDAQSAYVYFLSNCPDNNGCEIGAAVRKFISRCNCSDAATTGLIWASLKNYITTFDESWYDVVLEMDSAKGVHYASVARQYPDQNLLINAYKKSRRLHRDWIFYDVRYGYTFEAYAYEDIKSLLSRDFENIFDMFEYQSSDYYRFSRARDYLIDLYGVGCLINTGISKDKIVVDLLCKLYEYRNEKLNGIRDADWFAELLEMPEEQLKNYFDFQCEWSDEKIKSYSAMVMNQ